MMCKHFSDCVFRRYRTGYILFLNEVMSWLINKDLEPQLEEIKQVVLSFNFSHVKVSSCFSERIKKFICLVFQCLKST